MQYYKLDNLNDGKDYDCTIINKEAEQYSIPADQVEDMYSATMFEKEEKVTRTQMVEHLINAKEAIFTVTFRTKIQPADVEEMLRSVKSDAQLKQDAKTLTQNLLDGKLTTISGFLISSEEKLGRSTVIDVSKEYGKGWRQVDHRTVEELVLKNIKYTLKK